MQLNTSNILILRKALADDYAVESTAYCEYAVYCECNIYAAYCEYAVRKHQNPVSLTIVHKSPHDICSVLAHVRQSLFDLLKRSPCWRVQRPGNEQEHCIWLSMMHSPFVGSWSTAELLR